MIILINGPINAGKSTIGHLLMALLPRTAHVEVDTLRAFLPSVPLDEAIPINLENTVAVTKNLVRRGFNVVITYPLGDDDHAYLIEHLAGLGTTIHTFTLGPSLAVAVSDRGERYLSAHERQRIRRQYGDGRHAPPFGRRIDQADAPGDRRSNHQAHGDRGMNSARWIATLYGGYCADTLSVAAGYPLFNLVDELVRIGRFTVEGSHTTAPISFVQSIEEYVASFHGRSSFSHDRMTPDDAAAFDAAVQDLVTACTNGAVTLSLVTTVTWGQPQ